MVRTAMTIERERSRMLVALGMRVLVSRGRRVNLLLVPGRSPGLLVHVDSTAAAIRVRDGSEFLVKLGRWCATIANSSDILGGIAPRDRDPRVLGQRSPSQR